MMIHKLLPPRFPPLNLRRRFETFLAIKPENSGPSVRKANLSAKRKQRVKLPEYGDGNGRVFSISEFLRHPMGVESLLNTRTLQSFEPVDYNTYRCTLQKIQFLKFEVAPVLDLRVTQTNEDCVVELLSCRVSSFFRLQHQADFACTILQPDKFEGSKTVEQQNELFQAFMRNHIKWEAEGNDPFLVVDVQLGLTLEVFTKPFSLLPLSYVEKPGNLVMQSLLERLVPLLIEQLLCDYRTWVEKQLGDPLYMSNIEVLE